MKFRMHPYLLKKIISTWIVIGYSCCLMGQVDSVLIKQNAHDSLNSLCPIPLFSILGADAESSTDQQEVSSLLQSSRDVFNQFAGFQFGVAHYRLRGYSAKNQQVMINGVNVNNLETGYSSWSSWGGLNDVTRYTENHTGNGANRYGYSGPGGYTNIDSKASSFKKGIRISYQNTNRTYRNRCILTQSSGMRSNGWAYTLSASKRLGNEVYVPGTYFNATAFYVSIDKKIKDKHLLSFTGFVTPIEQGRSAAEPLEVYQLAKSHYYNSLWGYQNGKVRNSTVSKTKRPMLLFSHSLNCNTATKITSSLFYTYGKSSLSAVNWNTSANPRPDYYRYLPSYYNDKGDEINGKALSDSWDQDVNWQQLNWDRMIRMNQNNLYVLPSQLGQILNTSETRARYIVENKIENLKNLGFNTVYNSRFKNAFLSLGLNANQYVNRKYKEMQDLLGSSYWLDYDQFAQNLGVDPVIQQNDISQPDKKVYTGDRFGYDYAIRIKRIELWSQLEYSFKKIDVYTGFMLSSSTIRRVGFVANGKFPNSSKGLSKLLTFLNSGLKVGYTYKISGRHFLIFNANYMTRPPDVNSIFISPRSRNDQVSDLRNETVGSSDLSYEAKFPNFKMRVTTYATSIQNQLWLRSFWHDEYNATVNLIMKNVNQIHKGVEFGIEKTIADMHVLQAAFGYGQFKYSNRPTLEAWQDNTNTPLYTNRQTYLKNYKIGGSPQLVGAIGYRYNAKKHWFLGIYLNYFDEIFLEPNPDRRTQEAVSKYLSNELTQYTPIILQERLPGYYLCNVNAGKSFRLKGNHSLNFNLSINNIFNNTNYLNSGYEQLRWDSSNISKFDNKYTYGQGSTYMLMINYSF